MGRSSDDRCDPCVMVMALEGGQLKIGLFSETWGTSSAPHAGDALQESTTAPGHHALQRGGIGPIDQEGGIRDGRAAGVEAEQPEIGMLMGVVGGGLGTSGYLAQPQS